MTGSAAARPPVSGPPFSLVSGSQAEITTVLSLLWAQYSGVPPLAARTEIDGNVVTCTVVDAAGNGTPPGDRESASEESLTTPDYEGAAVRAVVRVTRQRVSSLVRHRDRDNCIATEVFTLEPSLRRGAPRGRAQHP